MPTSCWRLRLASARSEVVDALFPKRCGGCGRRGRWLCSVCASGFQPYAPPWCERCGTPTTLPCRCGELPSSLASLRSYGPYEGWLGDAIRYAKYDGEWGRIEHLAELLAPFAIAAPDTAVLVPVPLHRSRLRERGYNQSELLARAVGRISGRRVVGSLVRERATQQQVGLDAVHRRHNVTGAFSVTDGVVVDGLEIVLVDDVVTTGSTLGSCASTLLVAGADRVSAITLAGDR